MSEPRRRRGRGIDAIFDSADLDLGPSVVPQPRASTEPKTGRPTELELDPEWNAQGLAQNVVREYTQTGKGGGTPSPQERRLPGRPRSSRPPERELMQRGFYVEPDQDRMLDETKAALKSRNFTPDRSAIVRAALVHFARLDRFEQEQLVRQAK